MTIFPDLPMADMRMKTVRVLLAVSMALAAGCCSVAAKTSPSDSAGSKPRWHGVVMMPRTNLPPIHFYNKLNPIWWFGNVDEPHAPPWYRPNGSCRDFMWYMRNPFENFSNYVIGVADKKTMRYGVYPEFNGNPKGGWNFAVTRRRIVYLPFIDYKRHRFEFYFGWREHGNFGIKLNFRQKIPAPANPPPCHCVIIGNQEVDF
jgi:hypothetical protein